MMLTLNILFLFSLARKKRDYTTLTLLDTNNSISVPLFCWFHGNNLKPNTIEILKSEKILSLNTLFIFIFLLADMIYFRKYYLCRNAKKILFWRMYL